MHQDILLVFFFQKDYETVRSNCFTSYLVRKRALFLSVYQECQIRNAFSTLTHLRIPFWKQWVWMFISLLLTLLKISIWPPLFLLWTPKPLPAFTSPRAFPCLPQPCGCIVYSNANQECLFFWFNLNSMFFLASSHAFSFRLVSSRPVFYVFRSWCFPQFLNNSRWFSRSHLFHFVLSVCLTRPQQRRWVGVINDVQCVTLAR